MAAKPIAVVPRIDIASGDAVLFIADMPANSGMITSYAHVGQHSEAALDYYRQDTRPPSDAESTRCTTLVREWANQPPRCPVITRSRLDMAALRRNWT